MTAGRPMIDDGLMKPADAPAVAPWARRTMTVLFTDICGSTRLSRQLELEVYAELIARAEAVWLDAAQRHHGLVSRMQGDGAMLLFGYARAGERDVVDAVDAALFIHRELEALRSAAPGSDRGLSARSGIHTGVALVRAGGPTQGLYNVTGEAPNIAGTLEKHATAGEILVSTGSLKPHEGLYAVAPRRVPAVEDDLALDGAAGAAVVRITGRSARDSRFAATAQRGLTPLVGRATLLDALRGFLAAPAPDARIAVVTAPAGLGKTRLLHELASCPEMGAYRVLRGSCESYRETEVLQPFVQMLRAAVDAPDPALPGAERAENAAALARHDVDALLQTFRGIAQQRALLLVVDDWQWADDASRRLLHSLLDLDPGPRLLLTARPNPDGTSPMPAGLQLAIEPWDERQTAQVAQRWLSGADPLLVAKLHRYAGGVPLLVEELCHSTSALKLWQQLEGSGTPRDTGLKLLVASRLARLPDALAQVVQAASVTGHTMPRWLLDAVCGAPVGDAQLAALADADFLYPTADTGTLRFKHGLTRRAVYEHVDLALRRTLHRRARRALEQVAGDDQRHDALAALAYHCEGAGEPADAARFAERAGDAALRAFSMDLARGHYRRAMDALDRIAQPSPEQSLHWCSLTCRFAMASIFDPLALGNDTRVFEKAVRIAAAQGGDRTRHAECLYWLAYTLYGFGRFREAVERAREALALCAQIGHAPLAAQVEATLGEILVGTCDYDEAVQRIDAAVAAKRQRAGSGAPRAGPAIGSAYALACKGSALADRGAFDAASACFDEAIALLGGSTHPVGNSVRNWIAVAHLWQGRWREAQRVAAESVRIAEHTGALYLVAVSRSTLGFARWGESGDAEGLQLAADAVRWMAARNGRLFTSLHFGWLAEAYVAEGRGAEARALAAHVLLRARHGERLGEAIACRSMALLASRDADAAGVQRWLRRAEASAAARGSAREAALNTLARSRVQASQVDADAALAVLQGLGVALPHRSPLLGR